MQKTIKYLEKEMEWNEGKVVKTSVEGKTTVFEYEGLAGSSIVKELRTALEKIGIRAQITKVGKHTARDLDHTYEIRISNKYKLY